MMPSKLDAAAALETMDSMDAAQTLPPAFDFSALGELSALASEADRQFDLHYGTAQDEYLISCIYLAKVHELTARAGRYGGGTWTKWYESKGLGEGSVRRMIQNGDAFKSANVADLKQLPDLTRKDLNLIARSGCADQLVESAGNSQKVQALIDRLRADVVSATNRANTAEAQRDAALADVNGLKERADAAENHEAEAWDMVSKAQSEARAAKDKADAAKAERDAAIADVQGLKERADAAEAREEEAWKLREKAETRAKDAENQLAGSRQVAEAARLRGDKLKAENDALKQQPITAVVDEEEVDRRAGEKAYQLAADMTAELQAKLDAVTGDTEQDARNAYDSVLLASRSMLTAWQMVKPQFCKLPKAQRETLANQIVQVNGQINGEVAKCL